MYRPLPATRTSTSSRMVRSTKADLATTSSSPRRPVSPRHGEPRLRAFRGRRSWHVQARCWAECSDWSGQRDRYRAAARRLRAGWIQGPLLRAFEGLGPMGAGPVGAYTRGQFVSGGSSATIGQASEADRRRPSPAGKSRPSVRPRKPTRRRRWLFGNRALGRAAETDTAQPVTLRQTRAIGRRRSPTRRRPFRRAARLRRSGRPRRPTRRRR